MRAVKESLICDGKVVRIHYHQGEVNEDIETRVYPVEVEPGEFVFYDNYIGKFSAPSKDSIVIVKWENV